MSESKYNNITVGIVLIGFFALIISSSYAFFDANKDFENKNLNMNTITAKVPTFSSYSNKNLSLNITTADMLAASTTASKSGTGELIVTLSSSDTSTVFCTYDIVLETSSKYQASTTLPIASDTNYKYEISIQGSRATTGDTTGHSYLTKSLAETNFDKYTLASTDTATSKKTTIISGAEIYSKSTTKTQTKWTFTMNFYSLPVSQQSVLNQSLSTNIYVDNVKC